jgi:hypothetical protein
MSIGTAMTIRAVILTSALLLAAPGWAREKTDVIGMKNGDHRTGEIKGLDQDTLYVSLDYVISTMSVEWSKVARLESKQLFIVKSSRRLGVHRQSQDGRNGRRPARTDSGG